MMQYHSGDEDHPIRGSYALLEDLGDAQDALSVQKLQVEAIVLLSSSMLSVAGAIGDLTDPDRELRARIDIDSMPADYSLPGS